MAGSGRAPWMLGVVVCVVSVLWACAGAPSVTDDELRPAAVEATSSAQAVTTAAAEPGKVLISPFATATSPAQATRIPHDKSVTVQPTIPNTLTASPTRLVAQAKMPIFVEIITEPLSPDSSAAMPPIDTAPVGVFAFDPSQRVLLVQASIQILPTTTVLVGLTEASVPGKPYFSGALFQIPSAQTAPLTVIRVDPETDTVTLAYGHSSFALGPGRSLGFKEKREGEQVATRVTTIINHGRPAAIGLLSTGPGGQ